MITHPLHEALPGGHSTFASILLPGQASTAPVSSPHPSLFQSLGPSWLLSSVHYSLITPGVTNVLVCPGQLQFTYVILK